MLADAECSLWYRAKIREGVSHANLQPGRSVTLSTPSSNSSSNSVNGHLSSLVHSFEHSSCRFEKYREHYEIQEEPGNLFIFSCLFL